MTKKSIKSNLSLLGNLILLISIMILLIIGLIVYGIYTKDKLMNDDDYFFCGTISPIDYLSDSTQTLYADGKKLFKYNCATCHNMNMMTDMIGPVLKNTEERWADYPQEDLYDYIRNSQLSLKNKHPRAIQLSKKWQPTIMNAFPALTDEEIELILVFIEHR